MQVHKTKLSGLLIIEPKVYQDNRGFFFETYSAEKYKERGITTTFVQDNISRSTKHVLRGLHYQLEKPQAKLVSVLRGAVLDVAVDIRKGSPTFGQWESIELSDVNHLQFYIPIGFAHGFAVLSEEVDFFYKCSDYYHPPSEQGILWSDPDLAIDWKTTTPILSEKDKKYKCLQEIKEECLF